MSKTIMILGASILQLPAIKRATEMGLNVIAVDMNPNAIGFKVPGVKREVVSTIDTKGILEAARLNNIDGIMTLATDMPMQSVARVAKELGLVGISEDTALKATNKACMRDALKEAGVPVPLYFKVKTKSEFLDAIAQIRAAGYRCITKPADSSGSKGIYLLKDYESATLDAAFNYCEEYSRSGEIMVEEYMEGPEVSVETMGIDGVVHVIQITDKLTTGAPYFVEMGHNQPSTLSQKIRNEIEQVTIMANHAIGIENGPSHTEIKITKDGPKIVEIGARLGGDNITTHLVPLSTGVNLVDCCIRSALGENPNIQPRFSKSSAIRYFNQTEGSIKAIRGIEEAEKVPGVVQVGIVHGEGTLLSEINNSGSRMGFVIAQSDTPEHAITACENAINKIDIDIE